MLNRISALFLLTLFSSYALAQPGQPDDNWLKNVAKNDLSYQLTASLATEVGARMLGTDANNRAVDWAVQHFKQLGYDKVWTESFTFPLWERGDASADIVTPYKQQLKVLALGGSIGTPLHGVKAPVVEFASLDALKAAKPNSVKGKIAYVSYRMEKRKDGHGYSEAVAGRYHGASIASKKGAVAYVVRSIGTDSDRFPHTGLMHYNHKRQVPAFALSNPDADLLSRELRSQKPVVLSLRSTAHHVKGKYGTAKNVIAEITGSEKPNELVVLGAHLDSWDVGTGAVDDGIGVGMIMATGKHIKLYQGRPKRTLRVVLFNGEEFGLLGVDAYVKAHKHDIKNHTAGLEWDFGNGVIYELATRVNDKERNTLLPLAEKLKPYHVTLNEDNNAYAQSDLSKLTALGMPSFNLRPDGYTYFDVHHTDNDTLDKVDIKAMQTNTAIYSLLVNELLNQEKRFQSI